MAEFPYQFTPVELSEFEDDPVVKDALGMVRAMKEPGFERLGPMNYIVKAGNRDLVRRIQNLQITDQDIWVVTYPRSGTTWTQEMVWSILNNVDLDTARKTDIDDKFYFLDLDWIVGPAKAIPACEAALGQRRLIKTHLPLGLLPRNLLTQCKVIYVARNPKDVAISYYHHHRLTKSIDPEMKFPDFLKLFMKEVLVQDPYLANVKEALDHQTSDKMLFLWYEDMKADLPKNVRNVAKFLDKSLTEDEVTKLVGYLDIKNMKKNPAVNHLDRNQSGAFLEGESFIRKGRAGGWREDFTEEMSAEMDKWLEEKTKGWNVGFQWE